jgi:hypothetical protein
MKMSLLLAMSLFSLISFASDHIDGPVTTKHAASDITDLFAFPSPDRPGSLTVILNTYPLVPSNGHFADKIDYQILIRPASIGSTITTKNEVVISCKFFTPYDHDLHSVECKSSGKFFSGKAKVNVLEPMKAGEAIRVYAGNRSDPFFFNSDWAKSISDKGVLPPPANSNTMDMINVLSIVINIDVQTLFGDAKILAVAAQTLTDSGRLDRVGRPEITNVSLNARDKADLRDSFNHEIPFQNSSSFTDKYKVRLLNNITFYDSIDGKTDWNQGQKDILASVLVDDFLVVDVSKPCAKNSFLEIERSIVEGGSHQTCGGRRPNDDIMDVLYRLYFNAGKGALVSDGVNAPYRPISHQFPYLAGPDLSLKAKIKAAAGRILIGL